MSEKKVTNDLFDKLTKDYFKIKPLSDKMKESMGEDWKPQQIVCLDAISEYRKKHDIPTQFGTINMMLIETSKDTKSTEENKAMQVMVLFACITNKDIADFGVYLAINDN